MGDGFFFARETKRRGGGCPGHNSMVFEGLFDVVVVP